MCFKDCVAQREKDKHLESLDPDLQLLESLSKPATGCSDQRQCSVVESVALSKDYGSIDGNEEEETSFSPYAHHTVIRGIGGTSGSIPVYDLFPAPLPNIPIKVGFLTKLGEHVRSWKTRYFVATNAADNFVIKYFDDSTCKTLKGKFNCCGYVVQSFNDEEVAMYGQHGIKLIHPDEGKRVWYIRADSVDQQSAWIQVSARLFTHIDCVFPHYLALKRQVFSNACQKSVVDPNRDPMFTIAFQRSYTATRAAYFLFGLIEYSSNETDMLVSLCKTVVSREILDEFVQVNRQIRRHPELIHKMKHKLHAWIYPVVQSVWKKCIKDSERLQSSYENRVRQEMELLLFCEREIEDKYGDAIKRLIDPILLELQSTVCEGVAAIAMGGLLRAFELAYVSFGSAVLEQSNNLETRDVVWHVLEVLRDEISDPDGFLSPTFKELWLTFTEDFVQLETVFEASSLSSFAVYTSVLQDVKGLIHNAIFSFQQLISEEELFISEEEQSQRLDSGVASSCVGSPSPNSSVEGMYSSCRGRTVSMETLDMAEHSRARAKRVSRANQASRVFRLATQRRRSSAGKLSRCVMLSSVQLFRQFETTLQRLEHDIGSAIECRLQVTMLDAMETTLQEMALAPVSEMLQQAEVDDAKTNKPCLRQREQAMVNLQMVGERMVRDLVKSFTLLFMRRQTMEAQCLVLKWRTQIFDPQQFPLATSAAVSDTELHAISTSFDN
jgi:hypothetical protein